LEKGLAKSGASPASLRAKALGEVGFIAVFQLDPRAIAMLEEALALFKELKDRSGQALAINNLAHAVMILGYRELIPTLREESEALLEEPLEDRRAGALLLLTLGMISLIEGNHEQVMIRLEEALALFREVGDLRNCSICLNIMGMVALVRGDAGRAAQALEENLRFLRQFRTKIGTVYGLIGTAGVDVLRGRPARAARLFGAADALREAIDNPVVTPLERYNYDYKSYLAAARAELGETAFEAAFSEGQALSPEQAIEYALSADEPILPAATVAEEPPPSLSPREREVALLIARGLTNRQIAKELVISERTVTTHVDHILSKLGATSRTQVAAWIAGQQLLP
jgi:DNA-binding CsgD family transcriptional regulator